MAFEYTLKKGADTIRVSILDDGTMKIDTDAISMPNHTNAEGLVRQMTTLCGGKTEVKLKGAHLHNALHQHASDGHTHDHGTEHHH